jgi:predicted  nucleic acid-binding Zn-ribbon protein
LEILELIDSLEELIVQSRRLPVGGNLVVDRKRMLDLVDQLRLAVPTDLRQAAQVLESQEQILQQARDSGAAILQEADEERRRLVDQSTVVREAHDRAQAILRDAEDRARHTIAEADGTAAAHLSEAAEAAAKQLDDADQYALEVLHRLQRQLGTFLDSISTSIGSLEERR